MSEGLAARSRLTRSAALASIVTAMFLAGLKLWAVWRTDSTAMLGSLADTSLDLVASIATLIGVWIAATPADEEHRFGHGKAEALAAMFQVVLISISALGLAWRAIAISSSPSASPSGTLLFGRRTSLISRRSSSPVRSATRARPAESQDAISLSTTGLSFQNRDLPSDVMTA